MLDLVHNQHQTQLFTTLWYGLAVGMTAGILLLLWVQHELSYDRFHNDYQQIYKLSEHFNSNGQEMSWGGVLGPLAVYAKANPEIALTVRAGSEFDQNISNEDRKKIFDGNQVAYVDNFFSMFDFKLLRGNRTI